MRTALRQLNRQVEELHCRLDSTRRDMASLIECVECLEKHLGITLVTTPPQTKYVNTKEKGSEND